MGALSYHFYRTVSPVADVAHDTEQPGPRQDEVTKADTLNVAVHYCT